MVGLIPFEFPGLPLVGCAFTCRSPGRESEFAGNLAWNVGDDPAAVREVRRALKERLDFDAWAELRQVHGTRTIHEPTPVALLEPSELPEADGLSCSTPGLALCVKAADCQPILLAHASGRYVAALHVGWRGGVAGYPVSGVREFCERYGLDPAEVLAVRGPSLGPEAAEFVHFEREFGAPFRDFYDPARRTVDLWAMTRAQLVQAGLKPANIHEIRECSATSPRCFSYRRDKNTGRMAGIIWIKSETGA